MALIGIDLGTTNSLAVVYKDDHYEMIPNSFHEYLTPSVVSIDDNNQIIVGKLAKERLVTNSEKTTSLFKRKMGQTEKINIGDKEFLPEELSAFIVQQLIQDAQNYLGEEIDEVVISVPAYFNEAQRSATKSIGKILGVKVERLINEPSAAALACHDQSKDETFIVFDFGGGTLDVSVVDCFDTVTSIASIAGDNHLGGSDFDLLIARDVCLLNDIPFEKLETTEKESLIMQCEEIKMNLQENNSIDTVVYIQNTGYSYHIDNEIFYNLSKIILEKIRNVIAIAVNESGFEKDEFDMMITVGGSCHMPIVQHFLNEIIDIPVVKSEDTDTMVARGLGTYIGIKQRKENLRNLVLTDICPFSLSTASVDFNGDLISTVLIPKNSVLPAKRTNTFYTSQPGQKFVDATVYQGEEKLALKNTLLAFANIELPPNDGHEELEFTFMYDINSILCVDIKIMSTQEVRHYYVSRNKTLETIPDSEIYQFDSLSLELSKTSEIDLIREKAHRLKLQSNQKNIEQIDKMMEEFEELLEKYSNNLRKRIDLVNKMSKVLNQMALSINKNSIFKINLDDEGLVS